MAIVSITSADIGALVADATGEGLVQPPVKEEIVADGDQADAEVKEPTGEDADDIEGEDGLTPRQKREYSIAMKRTINKKHAQMKEAEEFAAHQYNERKLVEQRAAALERENAELKEKSKPLPEPTQPVARPDRKDFASDADFIEALTDWKTDQKFAAREREMAEQRARDQQNQIVSAATERLKRAIELVPDFVEVTSAVDAVIPAAIVGYMQRSELFAELGYHFAKNPDIVESLEKLPADEQLVQIGKIESKLEPFGKKPPEPNGATPSAAAAKNGKQETAPSNDTGLSPSNKARTPAPVIKPIDGNSGTQVEKDATERNFREEMAHYQKTKGVNLGLRKRH